jgi:signal transduction histidine kinase
VDSWWDDAAVTAAHRRAFLLVIATTALVVGGQLILSLTPYELHRTVTPLSRIVSVVSESIWLLAFVVLTLRQPTSEIWKLYLLWVAVGQVWLLDYLPVEPHGTVSVIVYILGDLWAAVFIHLVVAYPSGRLADRFDRRLVAVSYAVAIGYKIVTLLVGPEECVPACGNPIRILPSEAAWNLFRYSAILLVAVLLVASVFELWRHWRRAGVIGRRSLAPLLVAVPLWCVSVFAGYFADAFLDAWAQDLTHSVNPVSIVQDLYIPVAILIGAYRAQLARAKVAQLAVALGQGVEVGRLRDVLAGALRDPTLVLLFPAPTGDGFVDPSGRPATLPDGTDRTATRVEANGELLAVLVHDPGILEDDPGLLEAVGSVARLALANERLAAQVRAQLEDVRASRARIVDAADAERRRVERDLHDGAQQRLLALAMRLDQARSADALSPALLDEATTELRVAVAEVRDLSRGLHPPILTEAGLGPAIESLAERTPVPVVVDAGDGRFPPPIEAAAYYVVAESLTNVARYASASRVRVGVRAVDGRLEVTVRDDGRGGADAGRGSGLRGLADRVGALGGSIAVDSPPGRGTTITALFPLEA